MDTSPTIPIPNRVLSPVAYFIDRDDEINKIVNVLKGDQGNFLPEKRCVISGYPGIGKTEICRVVALQLRREFIDAQIYLKVDGDDSDNVSIFKILETIIHIFNPYAQISDDLETLSSQYLSIVDGKKVLIILDGLKSDKYIELLSQPSSCGLLITTDRNIQIANVHTLILDGLSQEDSEILLINICHRIGKYATRLSNICQNIPINLRLVSGYLNYNPAINVDSFISELEKHIEYLTGHDEGITEKILDYLFEQLTVIERKILSQLSTLAGGFNKELAEKTIILETNYAVDQETIETFLDTFTQLNLLIFDEANKYYYIQPAIQDFALKRLGNAAEVWYRLGKIFASSVEWYSSLANRGSEGYLLSQMLLDGNKLNIKNVLQYLLNHISVERDQILLEFRDLICSFGRSRFSPQYEQIPLLEAMMGASIRLQESDQLIEILGDLSNTYQTLGEKKKAHYYSSMQREVIHNRHSESLNKTFESIPHDNYEDEQIDATEDKITSASISSALEEMSINKTKIILTGFMATGKTTVGKLLAENLNYQYIDTDELIESRYERSISAIFQELGEEAFREMERAIVKEIAELESVVISTGGRLMLDPENVIALSRNSRVLCLVATPDEILSRVIEDKAHKRPLLEVPNPKERIVDLLQERSDKYLRFPQVITDEKQPIDIARSLVEFVSTSPKSLVIENPQKSYEYVVGAGLIPFIRLLTGIDGEMVIITDEDVKALYGPSCASIGHIITIPSGRQHKSITTLQFVYDQLLDLGFDRSGTIISLGGSIVGDIAGFTAATYMRGVNFVQCPTSLIAMVDTSVGGKTGIDLPQGKNIMGIYKQPIKVIADVATLQTLPQLDFASGMAEVIKHGLIAESNLLEQVEQGHWAKNWDRSPSYIGELQRLVAQAIQVKINIVQADPFEEGQRSILNLGHTFAYAIEQVSNNSYRHGEAVGLGLVAAANLSARLGFCDNSLQKRIESILESVNLPTRIPSNLKSNKLLQAMQRDKKKRAGQLRFILIRGIGQAFMSDEVQDQAILDTITTLYG